mmetsp:Transcript_82311/g.233141  ORF Transcript_82311/g.233141 Transcript_82311/m.233141 type:complete len:207 (-) Transcript_82311:95-715(-)
MQAPHSHPVRCSRLWSTVLTSPRIPAMGCSWSRQRSRAWWTSARREAISSTGWLKLCVHLVLPWQPCCNRTPTCSQCPMRARSSRGNDSSPLDIAVRCPMCAAEVGDSAATCQVQLRLKLRHHEVYSPACSRRPWQLRCLHGPLLPLLHALAPSRRAPSRCSHGGRCLRGCLRSLWWHPGEHLAVISSPGGHGCQRTAPGTRRQLG